SYGETYNGNLAKIPGPVLIDLARRIRNSLPEDHWGIMAETSPTGQSWLEALPGMQDSSKFGVRAFVGMLLPGDDYDFTGDAKKWQTAVEIGAKNGNMAERLSTKGLADQYIVMEPNQMLLDQARTKLEGRENVEFVQSDMTKLPLGDESVDLILGDQAF